MDLQNFARLLQQLVARGDITREEARRMMRLFASGQIPEEALPMPPAQATGRPTTEDERRRAWLFVLLLLGYSLVPGDRLPLWQRNKAHTRLAEQMEQQVNLYVPSAEAGNVRLWHIDMAAAIRAAILRQASAGTGMTLTGPMVGEVDGEIRRQMAWLYYFAGAVAARSLVGRPMSAGQIGWRSRLYGGSPWAMFYRAQETMGDNSEGWVVYYDAVDDRNTCRPCRQAELDGPYLPGTGPMPGDVCEGGGACRCRRRAVYDLAAYRRLTGVTT